MVVIGHLLALWLGLGDRSGRPRSWFALAW